MGTANNGKITQCREIELPELQALDFSSVPENTLYYYRSYAFPYCAIYRIGNFLKIEFEQHVLTKCWPMENESDSEIFAGINPYTFAGLMVAAIGELRNEGMLVTDEVYAYYFVTWTLTESALVNGENLYKKLEACNFRILKRALAIHQNTLSK